MSGQGGDQEAQDQPAEEAMSKQARHPPKGQPLKAQPATPFEKFTERAREALSLAQDEAKRFNHNFIGTEHLLLGLVREGEDIAAKVVKQLGVTLEVVRLQVVEVLGAGGRAAEPVGPKANVITCRVDDRDLDAIDALVEAGIRSTRSDAASWLISAGIDAHRELFERVYATVAEIRNLRAGAQAIAQQLAAREQEPAPPESSEPPSAGEEPPAAGG